MGHIETTYFNAVNTAQDTVERVDSAKHSRVIYVETPTNPGVDVLGHGGIGYQKSPKRTISSFWWWTTALRPPTCKNQ